jgi:hypothetical protein
MNYCTKCASLYSKPGTCNCYAPVVTLPKPLTTSWTYLCPCQTNGGTCGYVRPWPYTYTSGTIPVSPTDTPTTLYNTVCNTAMRCCGDTAAPTPSKPAN